MFIGCCCWLQSHNTSVLSTYYQHILSLIYCPTVAIHASSNHCPMTSIQCRIFLRQIAIDTYLRGRMQGSGSQGKPSPSPLEGKHIVVACCSLWVPRIPVFAKWHPWTSVDIRPSKWFETWMARSGRSSWRKMMTTSLGRGQARSPRIRFHVQSVNPLNRSHVIHGTGTQFW